ncbi:MAG: acyl-CoA dehydrogenase family protein [Hyphomicrobiaceae bacterium]|nr:acyl-CoA dehydrogenase family protein [Hyphomicrobiaceae bacterium]
MYARIPEHFLTREQEELRRTAQRLASEKIAPRAAETDATSQYPHDVFALLREHGIVGMTLPAEYGGAGASTMDLCVVTEELAKVCTTTALMPVLTNIVGIMLIKGGTEAQKREYLAPLATGEVKISNAVTEPDAGSDVSALKTRAEKRGDRWILNGTKCFITGAGLSDYYVVFAKPVIDGERQGITGFIVPKDAPGLIIGHIDKKMGIRGMPTGELILADCELPEDAVLGKIGDGMKLLLTTMTRNRPAIGARGVGLAQGAFDAALDYCRNRKAFGGRLIDMQGLQFKLADMAIAIEAARQLVHRGAMLLDAGIEPRQLTAILSASKCFATDTAMQVATEAVQLLGGYGYSMDFPVERLMRDAKHLQIVDGSNEIQRVLIARALAE